MNKIQQGDVILVRVDSIPAGAKPAKTDRRGIVLAEGETHGHAHVMDRASASMSMFGTDTFLEVLAPDIIKHEEHAPVTVPPGKYRVKRVQEVDPLSQEIRAVQD